MNDVRDELAAIAGNLGLADFRRHIFLCAEPTKPKCCATESGLESWEYLKRRIAELKGQGVVGIGRTKAN
ncbi:MAG: (2Fe-2S) ferredoxin domain-containing protein, partial [Methylococcaceae bacterium]|nr:(2Fe-2S) ferredoxin domain-containing protein [Methylococcaceae bacterium]